MRPRTLEEFLELLPQEIKDRHDFCCIFSTLKQVYELGVGNGYEYGHDCGYHRGGVDVLENDR